MKNIIDLDSERSHFVIIDMCGSVHVVPALLVENWIQGRVAIGEGDLPVVRRIIEEWFDGNKQRGG